MMGPQVLILHAEGDEMEAERLVAPLRNAGYEVVYRGGMLIGESVVATTDRTLWQEGPVVICGTRAAMGDSVVLKSLRAAKQLSNRIRIFPVRMEPGAALEEHTGDVKIADCGKDFNSGLTELLRALASQYPVTLGDAGEPLAALCAKQVENPLASQLRHLADSDPGRAAVWLPPVNAAIRLVKSHPQCSAEPVAPWSDVEWSARLLEQLGILCTGIGANEKLEIAELVLLTTVPFIIQRLIDDHVLGLKTPRSSDSSSDGDDMAEFVRFREVHPRILERARLLNDGSPQGQRLAEPIERWLRFRYALEKRKQWRETDVAAIVQQITGTSDISRAFEPGLIADLARAGASSPSDIATFIEARTYRLFGGNVTIRWRLLASLLLLAERMVLRPGILSETVLHHIGLRGEITLEDINGDVNAARFTLNPGSPLLVLHATCRTPTVDFALTEVADELDGFLRGDAAVLRPLFLQQELIFPEGCQQEIRPVQQHGADLYTKPHISFTMEPSDIRALLMGTQLWGDPALAYRELYQNALDACRYRRCRAEFHSIPYTPLIRFHEGRTHDGRRYVECEDNGVGMTRDLVRTCFARAGRRFATTTEFQREAAEWRAYGISMTPNSQFGIGVFSYFLVADEIEIETCRLGIDGQSIGQRFAVQIPTASSLFRITVMSPTRARQEQLDRHRRRGDKENGHLTAGTRVRLYLREVSDAKSSCIETLKRLVWFTETDVVATTDTGEKVEWRAGRLAPWVEEYTEKIDGESRHWWVSREKLVSGTRQLAPQLLGRRAEAVFDRALGIYRSERSETRVSSWAYDHLALQQAPFGRLLVDGIATAHVCPCAIVNLTGDEKPILSLDRTEIQSWDSKRAIERVEASLSRRLSSGALSFHWLYALWAAWPRQARLLWDQAVAQRAKWSFERWEGIAGERTFFPFDVSLRGQSIEQFWHESEFAAHQKILFFLWRSRYWGDAPRSRVLHNLVRINLVRTSIDARIDAKWESGHVGMDDALLLESFVSKSANSRLRALYEVTRLGIHLDASRLRNTAAYIGYELPKEFGAEVAYISKIDDREALLLGLMERSSHQSVRHLLNVSDSLGESIADCAAAISELSRRAGLPEPRWRVEQIVGLGPLLASDRELLAHEDDPRARLMVLLRAARKSRGEILGVARRFQAVLSAFGIDTLSWSASKFEEVGSVSEEDLEQFEDALRRRLYWNLSDDNETADGAFSGKLNVLAEAFGRVDLRLPAQDFIGRRLLSRDIDGREPWVAGHFTTKHLVFAAHVLAISAKDCLVRLRALSDQFGYSLDSKIDEAATTIDSFDENDWILTGFDDERFIWEEGESIRNVDVLWLSTEYRLSPEECARRLLRIAPVLNLKPEFANLGKFDSLPILEDDDWVLISQDLGGHPPWCNASPTVAHIVAVSARTGRSLAWLHDRLKALESLLGFGPPPDDATYVGIPWRELVSRSSTTVGDGKS